MELAMWHYTVAGLATIGLLLFLIWLAVCAWREYKVRHEGYTPLQRSWDRMVASPLGEDYSSPAITLGPPLLPTNIGIIV